MRRSAAGICAGVLASACAAAPAAAAPPPAQTLSQGWQVRVEAAAPALPQPAPPEETAPEGVPPAAPSAPAGRSAQSDGEWKPARVPGVFDTRALPSLYPGQVRRYRLQFTGPRTPPGYRWLLRFESVRRNAAVILNGRRIGRNVDPYTPFTLEARGLRPEQANELVVVVDGRKDPKLPEGWWNWAGIVRPVHLIPAADSRVRDLGTMSRVECAGPARDCHAALVVDGTLERRQPRARQRARLALAVRLRAPGGRLVRGLFRIPRRAARLQRIGFELPVPAPQLWSPESPRLYSARLALVEGGREVQVERRRIGLRSVTVVGGQLHLNNRRVRLRGASIHEDMPGSGAALSGRDMDRIVTDLKDLGANVTRAHYLMNEKLLERFDRAGILVWSQAPVWQRDAGAHVLWRRKGLRRALLTVGRTVTEARNHPSVLTHSVANELTFTPDDKPGSARFLREAQALARDLDPTLPISLDIKGRPGYGEQFTYEDFDMIGLNQYFGWYRWVADFSLLEPYIYELRDHYPRHAIVMTEWGAEARPELATASADLMGGYPFQTFHAQRTLDVIDRSPVLSGAIYWTLREFEIYPGWTGGAGKRPAEYEPNTRHHKGLISYDGGRKPAFQLLAERFRDTPLYP